MFADDARLIATLRDWVEKAERDLFTAAQILKTPRNPRPTDVVCFHSQQCAEKYLKVLLINQGKDVPRTHNIQVLMTQLPVNARPLLTDAEQIELSNYAVDSRYPSHIGEISLHQTREALKLARRVRKFVRARLPKAVLQHK